MVWAEGMEDSILNRDRRRLLAYQSLGGQKLYEWYTIQEMRNVGVCGGKVIKWNWWDKCKSVSLPNLTVPNVVHAHTSF